jgi:hypothetical protein
VSWGEWLPALRMIVVPSTSGSSKPRRPPDAKNKGLRSFETSGSTPPTTKRHNLDDFNLQYSEIRWPLSVLSVLADLQKGLKSEKLVREIRIHAFVTGWSCIWDGENKKPLQNFGVDTANIYTATVSFSRMLHKISIPYNKMFSIHKTTHSYGTTDRHAAFPYTIWHDEVKRWRTVSLPTIQGGRQSYPHKCNVRIYKNRPSWEKLYSP